MKTITEVYHCPRCDKMWGQHTTKVSHDDYQLVKRIGGTREVNRLCPTCLEDVERQQKAKR